LQIRLNELEGRESRRLASHRGPANKIALLVDSPHCLLSGGEDAVVNAIDVRENKAQKILTQVKFS